MDEQQEHAMEEVAQNFTEALIAAYRMSSRTDQVPLQADPELTRRFCNVVLGYLDTREGYVFAAAQEQLEQTRSDQTPAELPEEPAELPEQQASIGAYVDFLYSMAAYLMGSDSETGSYPWSEEAIERALKTSRS